MQANLIRKLLKKQLNPELFLHCCGVESIAVKLAAVYGAEREKASVAGLLHDYGKKYAFATLLEYALKHGIADHISLQDPSLLHAPVGSWLLQKELGIKDAEILEAVKMHTTGFPGMKLLAKIIYLADYIEPGRGCLGVNKIRKIAFHDLNQALLDATDLTIHYVLKRGRFLHPNTIAFRNSLLQRGGINQPGVLQR